MDEVESTSTPLNFKIFSNLKHLFVDVFSLMNLAAI